MKATTQEQADIANDVLSTLRTAGKKLSRPVTHQSSFGRSWVKYEGGDFSLRLIDGKVFVRAYSTNGNQISLKTINKVLESNGFSVEVNLERYAEKEYGLITRAN